MEDLQIFRQLLHPQPPAGTYIHSFHEKINTFITNSKLFIYFFGRSPSPASKKSSTGNAKPSPSSSTTTTPTTKKLCITIKKSPNLELQSKTLSGFKQDSSDSDSSDRYVLFAIYKSNLCQIFGIKSFFFFNLLMN